MALLVAGAVVLSSAVIAITTFRRMAERRQKAEARASAIARQLAHVAPAQLAAVLPVTYALDGNVILVTVTDRDGSTLGWHSVPRSEDTPGAEKTINVNVEDANKQIHRRVRLTYSLEDVRAAAADDWRQLGFILGVLAALGLSAAYVLARGVADPLQRLAAAMRRVQYGELGLTVEARSRGEIGELGRAFNEMSVELRNRERLRNNFARFVSSAVAEKVISENRTVKLGGERRVVTVLFADLRNFTTRAAHMPPERVVGMLNECFRALVDVFPRYGGTLDKFIGDGLMAVFNAPSDLAVHEICAVMAGLEMQRVMKSLNDRRRAEGQQELELGIGINTGEVVAGTFGSERRLEYTVIGASVNLAQRIEDHARGGELLIGESTYRAVRHLVEVDKQEFVLLKGLDTPVDIYKVLDLTAAVRGAEGAAGQAEVGVGTASGAKT